MTDKTKSQTYNFLLKNQSIEEIKQQANILVKEIKNKRHGGKTYRIDNNNQLVNDDLFENIDENLEPVTSNLADNVKEQKTIGDIWTKLTNYLNLSTTNTEELIQAQRKIQELEESNFEKQKENQQLKKQIEELKLKQIKVNFNNFKYNAITIYNENQRKKTGIEKIYEEILPINNELYFITTIQNIDNSINEEVIHFQELINDNIKVFKQTKQYQNINEYSKDIILIEEASNHNTNNSHFVPIKDFLKLQHKFKLKPTKTDWKIWGIIFGITLLLLVVAPICTFVIPALIPVTATALLLETKIIIAISLALSGLIFKGISSIFENSTKKVHSWMKQKFHLWIRKIPFINKRNFGKTKAELGNKNDIKKTIKNLTSDKIETKLETQYEILKQELDNGKSKNPEKLISNNTTNHNSNSILKNSSVKPLNPNNFDSSIRNTVNQSNEKLTSSNHNWNKVKCLLTT